MLCQHVALFTMGGDVQTSLFVFGGDTQTKAKVDQLQEHQASDSRKHDRDHNGSDLANQKIWVTS